MIILIIYIIVSFDQNISLIFYVKDGFNVRLWHGCDIRLVFTLPPRDSTLQYKRYYNSEITFLTLHPWNLLSLVGTFTDLYGVRKPKKGYYCQSLLLPEQDEISETNLRIFFYIHVYPHLKNNLFFYTKSFSKPVTDYIADKRSNLTFGSS